MPTTFIKQSQQKKQKKKREFPITPVLLFICIHIYTCLLVQELLIEGLDKYV